MTKTKGGLQGARSIEIKKNKKFRTEMKRLRFSANAFRKLPSIYVFSYFPFSFEGRMWDLIVSVPDHCLFFYFG